MQIKTIIRYHFTPAKVAITNKSTNISADKVVEKRNPSALFMGMQTGAAIVENSMEFP